MVQNKVTYLALKNNVFLRAETRVVWTHAMLNDRIVTREQLERRRWVRLFKSAVIRAINKHERFMAQVLVHRSQRFFWKVNMIRKQRKQLIRVEKYRIRNSRIYKGWTYFSTKAGMKNCVRPLKQWRRLELKDLNIIRTRYWMKTPGKTNRIADWLRGLEQVKKVQFALINETNGEGIKQILESYKADLEKITFDQRYEISRKDARSETLMRYLLGDEDWWPAVVLPCRTDNTTENHQRRVRHMGTGKEFDVPDDTLIPFAWLSFTYDEGIGMVTEKPRHLQDIFRFSWKFAAGYCDNKLDLSVLRFLLGWKKNIH